MYDIAIIGSGIGGMTAAIYAARAGLNHVLIEKEPFPGGQIIKTAEVDNFPGFEKVSGAELAMRVKSHCDMAGVKCMDGEVVRIEKMVNNNSMESKDGEIGREKTAYRVKLSNGINVETENVILAVGAKPRLLNVPGEAEFAGRGVSYCATCDGPLYRNKKVVVFGGGDSALRTVLYLAGLAAEVTLVHRRNEFRADKPLVEKAKKLQNVTIITDAVSENIVGNELISGVNILNKKNGEKQFLECNGVFIAVGTEPATSIFSTEAEQSEMDELLVSIVTDDKGYIVAGEDCKTSMDGIYAVGDCRSGRLKQLITAAADGAVAVAGIKADKDIRY